MADFAKLVIEIDSNGVIKATGNLSELVKEGKKAETATHGLKSSFSKLGSAVIPLNQGLQLAKSIIGPVARTIKDLTDAYKEQEEAELKLTAALAATHNAVGISKQDMFDYATELSRATGISDESIIATQALMTTFTQVGKETFPTAIEAAADMSKMFGQDLKQSAIQLGTALNDPIAGVGRLRRIGISFTESQKNLIKGFMETNDVASAQKVILDELNNEFGGVAKTMGGSALGTMERYKNSIAGLKEQLGQTAIEGLQPFTEAITTVVNRFSDWIEKQREITEALSSVKKGTATTEQRLISYQQKYIEQTEQLSRLQELMTNNRVKDKKSVVEAITLQEGFIAKTKEMMGILSRSMDLEKQAASLAEKNAEKDKEAADKKKKDAEELAAWLKRVNDVYAQTEEGRRDAIDAEIKEFEKMLSQAEKTKPEIEAILRMLHEQRDALDPATNKTLVGLRQQIDLLGKNKNEILEYKMATEGATHAEIKEAIALNNKLTAARKAEELEKRGIELKNRYKSETQKLIEAQKEINELYATGNIDLETRNAALRDLDINIKTIKQAYDDMGSALQNIAENSYINIFESLGKTLASSGDRTREFTSELADLGTAIMQQLPTLLLNGGLQLLGTSAWPVGVGLILASGLIAVGGAYMNEKSHPTTGSASANGNIFSGGKIIPFSSGGAFTNSIVSTPTLFPMAGGGVGLMGEAGPEAVMPLTRTSDGKLGVQAEGTGASVEINIINNTTEKTRVKKTTNSSGKQIYSIVIGAVKQGLASGELDGDFRNNYGLDRRGIAV